MWVNKQPQVINNTRHFATLETLIAKSDITASRLPDLYSFYLLLLNRDNSFASDRALDLILRELIEKIRQQGLKLNYFFCAKDEMQQLAYRRNQLVLKGYYRRQWMLLGMIFIGIPIGVGSFFFIHSFVYLPMALTLGLAAGTFMGIQKDKLALKKGKVLY